MDRSIFSVVLLPDKGDTEQLVSFSAMLNEHIDSKVQLGAACVPHITLVQLTAAESFLDEVWREVQALQSSVTELYATGLGFVPDGKGSLWIELGFTKSDEFTVLQSAITTSRMVQQLDIHNYMGDRVRPHITVGLADSTATLPAIQLEHETIFDRPFNKLRLAIGINGEHWTLTEIRHSA